jgi:hypothetical protein
MWQMRVATTLLARTSLTVLLIEFVVWPVSETLKALSVAPG